MEGIKKGIEKIESLVEARQVLEIDGRKWTPASLRPVIFEPKASTLECMTLSAIAGFIRANIDQLDPKLLYIHVEDVDQVSLVSNIFGDNRARDVFIKAKLDPELKVFPFERFLSQEEFVIRLNSMIQKSEGDDFDYLMQFVSKLTGGTAIEGEDDGITQTVKVKRGASGALTNTVGAKAIVKLSPYRTFRDIQQVQSDFLFRIKLDQNDVPMVALFEAGGGAWRIKAMERIAEYFRSLLPGQEILA